MRAITFLALAACAVLCAAGPAFADAATTVTIPYGHVASDVVSVAITAIGAAIVYSFRFLPAQAQWVMKLARVDQLLEKALASARSKVVGKLEPLTVTADVKAKIIADAVNYAVQHYPELVNKMGGLVLVQQKIEARLQEWIEAAAK